MGILGTAARVSAKTKKVTNKVKKASKAKKKVEDIDSLVKEQVAKARAAKAKREAKLLLDNREYLSAGGIEELENILKL